MGIFHLPAVHHATSGLPPLRRRGRRRNFQGRRQADPDQSVHVVSGPLGAQTVVEGNVVTFGLEHRVLGQIDAIGVDEIQYAKGHKYLTLVYQIDRGVTRLLWAAKEPSNPFRDSPLSSGTNWLQRLCWSAPICGSLI
jgi:hypothetical protein